MADQTGFVIAIDKPPQWTSFQVVNKLKWHLRRTFGLKKIKIGHAGTLDPLASGLLLVCVGSATKQIEQLQSGVKEYRGTLVLGATTPCFDLEQPIDAYYPVDQIDKTTVEAARLRFLGAIEQTPPLFSAVKVNGKRAYLSAREGEAAAVASRTVTIYDFEVTGFRGGVGLYGRPVAKPEASTETATPTQRRSPGLYKNPQGHIPEELPQMDFHIVCSKGTYIRSIARDFGEALGSGAFLGSLRRERIGDYTLADAIAVDAIETTLTADNPKYRL